MTTPAPGVPGSERTDAQRLHVVAVELAALAQNGLHYAGDRYEVSRYHRMQELSAELLALLSDESAQEFRQALLVERGHATPKVDVRTALFEDERVLLVQEARDGRWTLPGGWADAMDAPSEAAAREFAEEAGIAVRIATLAAVHDGTRHNAHSAGATGTPWHIYKLLFVADRTDDAPPVAGLDGETTDVGFFALDELPDLSMGRTTAAQLAMLLRHHHDRGAPTEFD
jgi:ADP-ribose pyrophosphatase YjhB (NUDIX family)